MATIKSGAGTDQWTIDPVSKAGRVTLYDAAGNPLTTLPVTVANFPASQLVTGVFFQATQPVSAVALPLPAGAATEATLAARLKPADTLAALGTILDNQAEQAVSITGAASAAVTATLPAVAAAFHYITAIEITKYVAAALTGAAVPSVVTSTNLPGALAWSVGTAGATVGGIADRLVMSFVKPLKSAALNVATTIVCPLQTNAIWRVNVFYHVGA